MSDSTQKVAMHAISTDARVIRGVAAIAPKILKQSIVTRVHGLALFRNNFMYKSTEKIMRVIIEAGIPQYYRNFALDVYFYERIAENSPQVFGIEDLHFGFVVWLCACGVSIAVFIIEIFCEILKKIIKKSIDIYLMKIILKFSVKIRGV
jgi:hypothetical protein